MSKLIALSAVGTESNSHLSPICWVDISNSNPALLEKLDRGLDYCPGCVDIVVAELREEYPQWADDIATDGGYEPYRHVSDSPAECDRCGKHLSCSVTDDRGRVTFECIATEREWWAADAAFCNG